jgi:hypothetical protein
MDVEPFVHGLLDSERCRPLLILLGVRDTPTGPSRLLDCLRALAQSNAPPIHEVEKWYRRLDQMVDTCSTADLSTIRIAFHNEKLVLTTGSSWANSSEVFLTSNEDDAPGVPVIRASMRDLAIWGKIGIADRPTAEFAIQWLNQLPSSKQLSQEDARRARALLSRHAARIWAECGHWLNLAREWIPTPSLEYALTMQTLVEWSHLHEWIKQKTADFSRLTTDIAESPPFSNLPRLAALLEERFQVQPLFSGTPEQQPWLNSFGAALGRIELDDETERTRIRNLADKLARTAWCTTPGLEPVPYLNGTPAGLPRRAEVVWIRRILYVDVLPKPKLARIVPDRLGRFFDRPEITAALNYCFGRSPAEVEEYLQANFDLAADLEQGSASQRDAIGDIEGEGFAEPETTTLDQSEETAGEVDSQSGQDSDDSITPHSGQSVDEPATRELCVRKGRQHPQAAEPSIVEFCTTGRVYN